MEPKPIKICDCTIRDGGLVNGSHFSIKLVHKVFQAAAAAGVDIMEMGYKNNKQMVGPGDYGPWRFCDEDMLRLVISDLNSPMQIAVMQDAHKARAEDLLPREKSVIDVVRIATYIRDLDKAILLANSASDKGYITFINIMALSHVQNSTLIEALHILKTRTRVQGYYIVDSFGSFYPRDIDHYMTVFRQSLGDTNLGIHCHNQQQLAFSNSIRATELGALFIDATLYGMGRAAGNCPLELLVGYLSKPGLDLRPLLEVIGNDIIPLQKENHWGYGIPHMLTGLLNAHPKAAIEHSRLPNSHPDKWAFKKFFNRIYDSPHSSTTGFLPPHFISQKSNTLPQAI